LSLKTDVGGLSVVWHQNHCDGFLRFDLKIGGDGFSSVCASKSMTTVCEWFSLKITRTVSHRFGPQTDDDGLSVVWPQDHWDGFLRFGLKTGGDGFSLV
jgi:hypothetical protein